MRFQTKCVSLERAQVYLYVLIRLFASVISEKEITHMSKSKYHVQLIDLLEMFIQWIKIQKCNGKGKYI